MKERPILFSAPMVRALLDGTKTQTRRLLKTEPIYDGRFAGGWKLTGKSGREAALCSPMIGELCPYGQPGDRLWVRETWARDDEDGSFMYRADIGRDMNADAWEQGRLEGVPRYRWRPSIHMPRWASRINLEVTGVRVERLQDISEADAMAEGARCWAAEQDTPVRDLDEARLQFRALWTEINGGESWDANPWVWVVEFRRAA